MDSISKFRSELVQESQRLQLKAFYVKRVTSLVKFIAKKLSIPSERVFSKSRAAQFVQARNLLYLVLRQEGCSFPEIGELTGKHHTTIIYGINSIREQMETDEKLAQIAKETLEYNAKLIDDALEEHENI